jgi:ADP-heptose:LPS heptosyltransferase
MASCVVNGLLAHNHQVTLICEEIGENLFNRQQHYFDLITYKRNNLIPDWTSVEAKLAGKRFDHAILTVPSNMNEGLGLASKYTDDVIYITPPDEANMRFGWNWHTVTINSGILDWGLDIKKSFEPNVFRTRSPYTEKKSIYFHLGPQSAYWNRKAFPTSLYRSIIQECKKIGYQTIIIGDKNQEIYAKMSGGEDFTGLPLDETIELLINNAAVFVSNDCGPAHLASALEIPTVTLWGPTVPERTMPFSFDKQRNIAVKSKVPCVGCHGRGFDMENCKKTICHDDIRVEEVMEAIKLQLARYNG